MFKDFYQLSLVSTTNSLLKSRLAKIPNSSEGFPSFSKLNAYALVLNTLKNCLLRIDLKILFHIRFKAPISIVAIVAQSVRALDCGSKSRGFESRRSPIFFIIHQHVKLDSSRWKCLNFKLNLKKMSKD